MPSTITRGGKTRVLRPGQEDDFLGGDEDAGRVVDRDRPRGGGSGGGSGGGPSDPLEESQRRIEDQRRRITEQIATLGETVESGFQRARQRTKERKARAIEEALAGSLAQSVDEAGQADLRREVAEPVDRQLGGFDRQEQVFQEDLARQRANNEQFLTRQAAAIPTIREQVAREIAAIRAESQAELAKEALRLAPRGGGGGGGGFGGGGGGGALDPEDIIEERFGGLRGGDVSKGDIEAILSGTASSVIPDPGTSGIPPFLAANPIAQLPAERGGLGFDPAVAQGVTQDIFADENELLRRAMSAADEFRARRDEIPPGVSPAAFFQQQLDNEGITDPGIRQAAVRRSSFAGGAVTPGLLQQSATRQVLAAAPPPASAEQSKREARVRLGLAPDEPQPFFLR